MLYEKSVWDSLAGTGYWYKCHLCPEYHIVTNDKVKIESEGIRVGNFKLIYFPNNKTAVLFKDKKNISAKMIHKLEVVYRFSLNELTHEQAVQWVNKLKTFVLFS